MDRIELIRRIFEKTEFQNYLEIGCQRGTSFFPLKAKNKYAVDPVFRISLFKKLKWIIREPTNRNNKFFEVESDTFFEKQQSLLENSEKLDIILVDGLHTFEAALKDVLNSLKYLNPRGLIIMHDCKPPHKAASLPTKDFPTTEERRKVEGWTGEWCGDVWKAIVYLRRKFSEDLEVFVLDTDYGLGIVKPKTETIFEGHQIDRSLFNEIDALDFEDLVNDYSMIELKPEPYYEKVLEMV